MTGRLPHWFSQRLSNVTTVEATASLISTLDLNTICESSLCPNICSCYSRKTATFLILGDVCTRNCLFCNVKKGRPRPVSCEEPGNILRAVEMLDLKYAVITSVSRDDLPNGGASQFASVISILKNHLIGVNVEVLIPDFGGCDEALSTVIDAKPCVINHNVEMVPRLYNDVRPEADYYRSVEILYSIKQRCPDAVTKSGIMLGLGESREEVIEVMSDLREAGCDLLTIGQYLQPSFRHYPIARFVHPEEFADLSRIGLSMGFAGVASGPMVRSSFLAEDLYLRVTQPSVVARTLSPE